MVDNGLIKSLCKIIILFVIRSLFPDPDPTNGQIPHHQDWKNSGCGIILHVQYTCIVYIISTCIGYIGSKEMHDDHGEIILCTADPCTICIMYTIVGHNFR